MFRKRRLRRRPFVPFRALIPNLLTTVALCSGLAALHFTLKEDWDRALSAIAVSAIFDALDGRAARLLRSQSKFGEVLDSLSDFLSFGVAPAMILYKWLFTDLQGRWEVFGLAAAMTFALCSALRLARFTAAPKAQSTHFVGMPTPAAAGAVLVPVMLYAAKDVHYQTPAWIVILYTFFIAWLMISRQPMFSMKKLRIRRRHVAPILVIVGLLVVLTSMDPWVTAALLAVGYVLTLPWSIWTYRRGRGLAAAVEQPEDHDPPAH
jgi:CDP-diacylglycerol--serine O-phosphatidyltransferase